MIKFTDITGFIIEEIILILWKLKHINANSDYITDGKFRRDCNTTTK